MAIARNEPCPCGSGLKYKKCCEGSGKDPARQASAQASAQAPGATAARAPTLDYQPLPSGQMPGMSEALALVTGKDEQAVGAAVDQLGALFARGGPLAHWRFPADAFSAAVDRHLHDVVRQQADASTLRIKLWQVCAPELVTPERVEKMLDALTARATDKRTPVEERIPLWVGTMLAKAAQAARPFAAENVVPLSQVFEQQLQEHVESRSTLTEMGDVLKKYVQEGGGIDLEGLEREHPELVSRLRSMVEGDSATRGILEDTYEAVRKEVLDSFERGEALPVLTGPEFLFLVTLPRAAGALEAAGRKQEKAAHKRLSDMMGEVLDEGLEETLRRRLQQRALDASLPEASRKWYTQAALLVGADSFPLVQRSLMRGMAGLGHSEEEAGLLEDFLNRTLEEWTPERLEGYRALLLARGDSEGARWVERARDNLQASA